MNKGYEAKVFLGECLIGSERVSLEFKRWCLFSLMSGLPRGRHDKVYQSKTVSRGCL